MGDVRRDLQKVERIFTILNLLRERDTITASELAEYCGTTQRTIYRDMALLEKVGVHYVTEGKNGYHFISGPVVPHRKLTQEEWMALTVYPLVTNDFLHNDHPVHYAYRAGFEKLKGLTRDSHTSQLLAMSEELGDRIRFHDQVSNKDTNHVMPLLFQAMVENKAIEVEYYAIYNDTMAKRVIHPYYIIPRNGHLYVLAYCTLRKDFRTFRLNRFLSVVIKEETFVMDPNFNVDEYLSKRWAIFADDAEETKFVVRFHQEVARYVDEYTFYAETKIEKQSDGSLLLHATVRSRKEFLRWVRGFGLNVEVLEPVDVRDSLYEEYRQLMTRYHLADRINAK